MFFVDYRGWPVYKRVEQIKKHFQKRIKEWKETAIPKLDLESRLSIERLKMVQEDSPERQQRIIANIDRKNEWVQKINHFAGNGIKAYIKQISFRSALECYRDFFTNPLYFAASAQDRLAPPVIQFIQKNTLANLQKGILEIEDLAPVLYIKYRLDGLNEKIKAKHVVIDEAQDFNTFQFYTLRQMIKDSSFTILGDLAQGIHSYRGTTDWEEVRQLVFEGNADLLTLEQSYRTTVEIMDIANLAISHWQAPHLMQAKPVIRHGEPVQLIAKQDLREVVSDIEAKIGKLQVSGIQSIAIIGKTAAECRLIMDYLKESSCKPMLISGRESEYQSGLVVVPSYLVKGLEFDAVFVANADQHTYQYNELDTKLLYVTLTRPLHQLTIYYTGEMTPLLRPVA